MENLSVYYIQNIEELNTRFIEFKQSANIVNEYDYFVHLSVYIIGIDLEYCTINNLQRPCVLQLSTSTICLVIHLLKFDTLPEYIHELLTSPAYVKVGINIDIDMIILSNHYNLGHCSGVYDIQQLSILGGITTPNLLHVYSRITGDDTLTDLGLQTSNWTNDILTDEQIMYASQDAYMSYMLYMTLMPSIQFLNTFAENEIVITTPIDTINLLYENYIGKLEVYSQRNKIKRPRYKFIRINDMYESTCIFNGQECVGIALILKLSKQNSAKAMCEIIV